jgi:hypothetical protein
MYITRITFESYEEPLKAKFVAAVPENYKEFFCMCFRSGYVISNRFEQNESWYPVFEKRVAMISDKTLNGTFVARPIFQDGTKDGHLVE